MDQYRNDSLNNLYYLYKFLLAPHIDRSKEDFKKMLSDAWFKVYQQKAEVTYTAAAATKKKEIKGEHLNQY